MQFYLKEYTWLFILMAILISFIFPNIGSPFRHYLIYFLMSIMFLSFINIDIKTIIIHSRQWKNKAWSLIIIHLLSPFFILILKPFFSDEIFLGLIIATVISSGMSVVFLSDLYGGLAEISLVVTVLSNLFSPLSIPLLILLFAKTDIKIDAVGIGMTMLKIVIFPFLLAILIKNTKAIKPLRKYANSISIFILFFMIIGIISPIRSIVLINLKLSLQLTALIIIMVFINFFLGYLLGSNKSEKISYAITSSYKNFALATVIALSLFSPMVALPSVVYTLVNNILLIPLQLVFLKRI